MSAEPEAGAAYRKALTAYRVADAEVRALKALTEALIAEAKSKTRALDAELEAAADAFPGAFYSYDAGLEAAITPAPLVFAKPKGGESVPAKTYHGPFMPKPSTPAQADPLDQVMTFRDFKEAVGLIYVTNDRAYLHDFQFERLARTRAKGGRG
jgi:hypothetical protein